MKLSFYGVSDIGQVREANEDAFVIAPEIDLAVVADGLGGYKRGDVASDLACNVVREAIHSERVVLDRYRLSPTQLHRRQVLDLVEKACARACTEVHAAGQTLAGPGYHMGTTLDLVLVVNNTAFTAHVGDGRIYLFRGRNAHLLTQDHTLVNQQLHEGTISKEEARKARFKNVVTRAMGILPSVKVDLLHFELAPGDQVVLCTDGLHRYLGVREMAFLLAKEVDADTPGRMVAMANARGGRDNISLAIVSVADERPGAEADADREPSGVVRRLETLRKVDLFQYCTTRELMIVHGIATARTEPAGTVLFREGDRGRELFVLLEGRVRICKDDMDLTAVEPPGHFGEMSFIDEPHRSATAVTTEQSSFLVIRQEKFQQMMRSNAELAAKVSWQLLRKLSRALRETNAKAVADTILLDPEFEVDDD